MPENKKQTKGKNIASRVREAVTGPIEQAGYRIWDVTYYKDVSEMVLEIAIDRAEPADGSPALPLSTDDCMTVTKIVDPILDELDPIEESYSLMVSGGGCVRDLRLPEHFAYAAEKHFPVTVKTFTAVTAGQPEEAPSGEGKKGKAKKKTEQGKQFDGYVKAFDDETLTLETETGILTFDRKQIAKATAWCDENVRDGNIPDEN
ncbi:MAG: hypothetical protein J5843_01915 [Clostridia bacterium]|nr:hypothetical protein [Clostridia bacterium]